MKKEYTGGARIGLANYTWPFAKIIFSENNIIISTLGGGKYIFNCFDITSIEKVNGFLPISKGIRINHTKSSYSKKIIFWCVGDRDEIFDYAQSVTRSPRD